MGDQSCLFLWNEVLHCHLKPITILFTDPSLLVFKFSLKRTPFWHHKHRQRIIIKKNSRSERCCFQATRAWYVKWLFAVEYSFSAPKCSISLENTHARFRPFTPHRGLESILDRCPWFIHTSASIRDSALGWCTLFCFLAVSPYTW